MIRTWRRLRNLWRERTLDREFREEIAFHLEQRTARNIERGMTAAAAAAEARRQFGSELRAREGMREARLPAWMAAFAHDLRVAVRMLRRQPLLAALAVLTLSFGIGAIAAVGALIDAMVIRPLPYAEADRLVAIIDTFQVGPPQTEPTVPELLDLRRDATTLAALSFADARDFELDGGREPLRVVGSRVESGFFGLLRVRAQVGRLFTAGDGAAGQSVAVLSDGLWRSTFGADRSVVGRTIRLNGLTTEVIGVLPPSFRFDPYSQEPIAVYVPWPEVPEYLSRDAPFVNVRRVTAIARLRAGETALRANAEVRTLSAGIARAHAELYQQGSDRRDTGFAMRAVPLQEYMFGASRGTARMLLVATLALLLLGSFNMGQFLVAHAVERRTELAMRAALGAGRSRIALQLAAEAIALTAVITSAGLLLGAGFVRLLRVQVAVGDDLLAERIALGLPVVILTIAAALLLTVAWHLLPALRMTRATPLHALAASAVAPKTRLRHVLIAAQVAVTVILLGVSGLLVRSLVRLQSGDRGYVPEGVTIIRLRAPLLVEDLELLYRRYLERIRELPDVAAVAMASQPLPLFPGTTFSIEDRQADGGTLSRQQSGYTMVSPDYFSTLGVPLLAGRTFTDADAVGRQPVAIVNQELAARFWPGESPLGHRLRAGEGPRASTMTVIGVVGNVRPAMQLQPIPQVYVSYQQQREPNMVILLRTRGGHTLPLDAIKREVRAVQADQPLFAIRSLSDWIDGATAEPRRGLTVLLGTIALLAVLISGAGLFTLVTYVTTQRRREVAVRRAIGADAADVVRLVSGSTLRWTGIGLIVGVAGASGSGQLLRASYAGIVAPEPWLLPAICVSYLAIAAMAVCGPIVSALRDDPAAVLRTD